VCSSDLGYRYILVCIDFFTNWVEALPLRTIETKEIISKFFSMIIARHGCPSKVLTDQGTQFMSTIFKLLCDHFGIEKLEATAYHQQCNGKVEKFNRFLTTTLATLTNKQQSNWDEYIDHCLFVYRITYSRVLNDTPFYIIYGRVAVIPDDMLINPESAKNNRKIEEQDKERYKLSLVKELQKAHEKLKLHKDFVQETYKQYYDRTQKPVNFEVGEQVYVYFPAPKQGFSYKLLAKWDGPFEVKGKLNEVTYRVRKQDGTRELVVHVQRMQRYRPWKNTDN